MWLDRHMAASTDTHVWMVPVPDKVRALSTGDALALVKGSSFARRQAGDSGARLCEHGRMLFAAFGEACHFCAEGVPALCEPTFAQQRANAAAWAGGSPR
jgi:hypothetical protein